MRIATIAVLAGMTGLLHAQQPATGPAAENALARMAAAYQTLPALHIKVRWSAKYSGDMSEEDFPVPGPNTLELRMQRPNKLFLSSASKHFGKQSSYLIVSDGTTLSYWQSWTNSYLQTEAPATLAGIARRLPNALGFSVDGTWESESIAEWDLLTDDQAPSMVELATESGGLLTMTGPEKLGGAAVSVVRITRAFTDAFTFTLEQRFLLDAESSLLRGLAMSARGKHPETGRDSTFDMQGRYDVLSAQPTFSEADFRFVAPRGARPGLSSAGSSR